MIQRKVEDSWGDERERRERVRNEVKLNNSLPPAVTEVVVVISRAGVARKRERVRSVSNSSFRSAKR